MNSVISLQDRVPHIHIKDLVTSNIHVLPISMIRDISTGKLGIDELEDRDGTIRALMYMLISKIDHELEESR